MNRLRRLVGVAAALLAVAASASAAEGQTDLEKKRDEKRAAPFLQKAPWITDYAQARAESQKSGKLIFAYFTRSYAH